MRYRSPTLRRQSTRSRYRWGSAPVNGLFSRGQVVVRLRRQVGEGLVHIVLGRIGDDQRVAPRLRPDHLGSRCGVFMCYRGYDRRWMRGVAGAFRWSRRAVGAQHAPVIEADRCGDGDDGQEAAEVEVGLILQVRVRAEHLLEQGVEQADPAAEDREDAAE